MLQNNLMEEKHLDFNQPFLSVRRFTSTAASSKAENKRKTNNSRPKIPFLPAYRSELKSGPIRNLGTVPFLWEKTPGNPKYESNLQAHGHQRPPLAPKLPPGWTFDAKKQTSDRGSDGETVTQSHRDTAIPSSGNASYLDESVANYGSSKDEMEETRSYSSEDGDEAYVDARDTLSRTDSFFLNCSVSGVSGLDGPDMKPHGIFSTDPQTRDLMMGRFLPAAKAMASESPQYTFRKQPVAREQQPRQVKQLASVEKRRPVNQNRLNNMPYYMQRNEMEESEVEDEDYNGPGSSSTNVCGLLPRFCLQLNPVPGLKKHTHGPVSSVRRVQAKSSYATSSTERGSEHGKGSGFGQCSTAIELKEELSQTKYGSDSQKPDRSSMYNLLQGNGESPCPNEFPEYCHHEDKDSLAISEDSKNSRVSGSDRSSKAARNFRELLACDSSKWESDSASPLIEKTLYVDSVHKVKSPGSSSNSSDMKGNIDYQAYDVRMPVKSGENDKNSFLRDIEKLNVAGGKVKLRPESLESVDSCFQSSSDRSFREVQMVVPKQDSITFTSAKMAEEGKIDSESRLHSKSNKSQSNQVINHDCIMSTDDGKIDLEGQLATKLSKQENSHVSHSHLPPPLPPSESWLKRTLPSISSRSSSSQSRSLLGMNFHSKAQASKTPTLDPTWEMIVRTKNVQLGHLRRSEEILTPIPEALNSSS